MKGIRVLTPVVLIVALLAGCSSGAPDPVTESLQQKVVDVATAASQDDLVAAEAELAGLETLLAGMVADGTVDEQRRAGIQAAIDQVKADIAALRAAETPDPDPVGTPTPTRAAPTPTITPSASPSVSPSPTVSVEPTPSPSPSTSASEEPSLPPAPTPTETSTPEPTPSETAAEEPIPTPTSDDDEDEDDDDPAG